jgi:hypothetical protein
MRPSKESVLFSKSRVFLFLVLVFGGFGFGFFCFGLVFGSTGGKSSLSTSYNLNLTSYHKSIQINHTKRGREEGKCWEVSAKIS